MPRPRTAGGWRRPARSRPRRAAARATPRRRRRHRRRLHRPVDRVAAARARRERRRARGGASAATGRAGATAASARRSGRNLPDLVERFGAERALAVCRASAESVAAIGAWCEDAGRRRLVPRAGYLLRVDRARPRTALIDAIVAAAPTLGAPASGRRARRRRVRARCDSPLLPPRRSSSRDDATVHPARLALGLRERVIARGVRVYERSRGARAAQPGGGVVAETDGGRVRAGAAVLAVNAAAARLPRRCATALAVTSSHIVLTEPVPDVLERARLDRRGVHHRRAHVRALLPHHERRPDRVRLGRRAARRRARASTAASRSTADVARETARHLVEILPARSRAARSRTPGAARSTSPRATCRRSARSTARRSTTRSASPATASARRTSPAGSSPRCATGETPRGRAPRPATPARVPPEPVAWAGGMVVRAAFLRKERHRGRGPPRPTR